MLKTRIITAIGLVSVFLLALFYLPPIGWLSFSTLVAALAGWEWGALIGIGQRARVSLGIAVVTVSVITAFAAPNAVGIGTYSLASATTLGQWFYFPSIFFWLAIVPLWLKFRWRISNTLIGTAVGSVVILPTWLALIQIRQVGEFALLALMATVWLADIAAYFSGRRFGRRKLAPAISPGKTWEGAVGGVLAVIVYGFLFLSVLPSALAENKTLLFGLLVAFAALSIVGDLFESLLKRQAGLKDSSSILPGHGGVLDRIDSLTLTLPIVATALHHFSL
ncbi:MAG: phosphatidate cytidylyltransferase [Propionivibrio sp.]